MNHLACSITLAADKPTGTHEFTNELGAQLVWDPGSLARHRRASTAMWCPSDVRDTSDSRARPVTTTIPLLNARCGCRRRQQPAQNEDETGRGHLAPTEAEE